MRNMLTRIGFIDETSLKTNRTKTTGWSPCGARLVDHAPFGHWQTQTFIAALRHDRLDAPWVGISLDREERSCMPSRPSALKRSLQRHTILADTPYSRAARALERRPAMTGSAISSRRMAVRRARAIGLEPMAPQWLDCECSFGALLKPCSVVTPVSPIRPEWTT